MSVPVYFITVLTPSGQHILSICFIDSFNAWEVEDLGDVWLSMVVLVGVSLPLIVSGCSSATAG